MQAFHNDPAVKAKYVNRIAAHIAADNLIHGIGWENGKGCAVGCTFEAYEHARGPVELGLPEWLMRLEDSIYEGLLGDESRDFVAKFLAVIPVGADVEPVRHKLAIRRIDRLLTMQRAALNKAKGDVKAAIVETIAAIEMVRRCHEAEMSGNSCDWSAAAKAAWRQEAADLLELLEAA